MIHKTLNQAVLADDIEDIKFKLKGKINKKNPVHLKRKDQIIFDVKVVSFQKEKSEIMEAKSGSEVGIVFKPDIDFKIGDVIISYKKEK